MSSNPVVYHLHSVFDMVAAKAIPGAYYVGDYDDTVGVQSASYYIAQSMLGIRKSSIALTGTDVARSYPSTFFDTAVVLPRVEDYDYYRDKGLYPCDRLSWIEEILRWSNTTRHHLAPADNVVDALNHLMENAESRRYQRALPRIVSAAMRVRYVDDAVDNSEKCLVIASPRHYDAVCHATLNAAGVHPGHPADHIAVLDVRQGFVDQFGTFWTREEAYRIARAQNQLYRHTGASTQQLYSEDLY